MHKVDYDFKLAESLDDAARYEYLRATIKRVTDAYPRGNTLDLQFLKQHGCDPDLLAIMRDGVVLPLKTEFSQDDIPREYKNHKSFLECSEHAAEEFERLHAKGKIRWLTEKQAKRMGVRIVPMGGVLKPRRGCEDSTKFLERMKLRLIIDLKHGRVNSMLDWISSKMKFATLEDAVEGLSENSYQWVVDISDCFFVWPISECSQNLLGFRCEKTQRVGVYTHLPFGLAPGPEINDRLLGEVIRICPVCKPVSFVDDLHHKEKTKELAWRSFEQFVVYLLKAGVPPTTKPTGLLFPRLTLEYIGWIICSATMMASIPERKAAEGLKRISETKVLNDSNQLTAKGVLSTTGFLCHLAQLLQEGRRFLSEQWAIVTKTGISEAWQKGKKQDPLVSLTPDATRELDWWTNLLERGLHEPHLLSRRILGDSQGVPTSMWTQKSPDFVKIESLLLSNPSAIEVYESDASKLFGFSWTHCSNGGHVTSGKWGDNSLPPDAPTKNDEINVKELWTIIHLAKQESPRLAEKGVFRVLVRCDNKAAVRAVNKRYSKDSPRMTSLCGILDDIEREHHVYFLASHIAGKNNIIADLGSRSETFGAVHNSDPLANVQLCKKLYHVARERFFQDRNPSANFKFDMFSNNDGSNAHVERYWCPNRSAFLCQDFSEPVFSFPPPAIAAEWVRWAISNRVDGCTVLVMNERMWKPSDIRFVESHYIRFLMQQPGSKCFRIQNKWGLSAMKTHYPVWFVKPRKAFTKR